MRGAPTGGAKAERRSGSLREIIDAWPQQTAFGYPYVGSVLESIAVSYDRETEWQDSEATVSVLLRALSHAHASRQ